ncbi:MAG: glycoside hydrolase family 28 protein [Prevotella sp.]|nr:glycoside hydrolase family 28 protein [Prevotella sp.]
MRRKLTLCGFLIAATFALAGNYANFYKDLPVTLSEPVAPTIPANTVNLKDFGGVGDGITSNTKAFAKAISALNKQGGGHLIVPSGIYLTGPISLKDNIDLHVERNAIILFSPDKLEFMERDETTGAITGTKARPGISASKRHNISITGEGVIDGNGEWWRGVKRSKVSDTEWKRFKAMGGTEADNGTLWYPFGLKHFDNIADSYKEQESMRTHLIRFTDCENVLVQGVTVQNAPKFHIVPQRCHNVIIDGVTVRCPWNAQNGDGIDLMQCRDVLIVNNMVDVGDDGICLKGGVGNEGLKHGPCENLLIENNTVFHAHGGFVIGSEFSGGMNNIVVRRNLFSGTDTGLRFKSGAGRGGKTSRIYISDIMMSDIVGEAIVFETTYADRPVGSSDAITKPKAEDFIPEFCDIHISNVTCRDAKTAISAHGTLDMIHDIYVSNSVFFYTNKDKDIEQEGMVKLSNVNFATFAK